MKILHIAASSVRLLGLNHCSKFRQIYSHFSLVIKHVEVPSVVINF